MIVDYGKSIFLVYQSEGNGHRHECTGVSVGTMFLPKDLINKLYIKIRENIAQGYCRKKPDEKEYEFYQWNGDREEIKSVSFLNGMESCFEVGDKKYENFHLDYHDPGTGEIMDLYPGDYIINRKAQNGMKIDICKKSEFESEFYFQK